MRVALMLLLNLYYTQYMHQENIMPVFPCQKDNKPGFKWGEQGFCYTYTANNSTQRESARNKAAAQGRAIQASGGE